MSTTAAAKRVSKFTATGRDFYYAQRREEREEEARSQGSLSSEADFIFNQRPEITF